MRSAGDLATAFRRNPDTRFTAAEAEILAAAAEQDLWAAKACALHHFRAGNPAAALPFARLVATREPSDEAMINLAVLLRGLHRFEEAIALLQDEAAPVQPIRRHDMLCALHAALGRIEAAREHGDRALRLKDAATPAPVDPPPPVHRPFDLEARSRNVIAFSLWGSDQRYLQGALNNAIVARYLYPGWTPRFYTDTSVPAAFRAALVQNGAQVALVEGLPAEPWGLFWRFLVEDDEAVDFYLVRDVDSVLNIKERAAVAAWLHSGRAFHVMRDHIEHSELMLAGMWGAQRGNIGRMRARVRNFLAGLPPTGNYVHRDQHFLRDAVWPIVRRDVLTHDRYFTLGETQRYDAGFDLPRALHIGQNDWVHYRRTDQAAR